MSGKPRIFDIEIVATAVQWWNFNVYVIAAGYDGEGGRMSYDTLVDKIRDIDINNPEIKVPLRPERTLKMTAGPCVDLVLYIYALNNALPESRIVRDCPPFPCDIYIRSEGKLVEHIPDEVNQNGGLTISEHRVGKDDIYRVVIRRGEGSDGEKE